MKKLQRYAIYCSRAQHEAEDLLQDALLEAVRQGRTELSLAANLRWLRGVIRHLALERARSAVRSRLRDTGYYQLMPQQVAQPLPPDTRWLQHLPAGQRLVARLIMAGHNRQEICYLLGVSDVALRQRLSAIRKQLQYRQHNPHEFCMLKLPLPYGQIRQRLLPLLAQNGKLGSHDPDGHLFIISHLTKSSVVAT
ncbi:RNA polymerase sigma-70 factor, ECF subfamily [Rheinheimera pacifica]|uniref:RNA polymerase sigma-70 factor, ECF subfamily n=1 Tax=Rheinheimera pacifica TaxID=173990 RepID=A0A1H6J1Y5_9GAMM|nr:hypothetical protein [Rheinheimera pacifica]SEH55891.1 RNA polymerase sigma-70 factor, ECF subfamily [Rheinheimera pacifica]